MTTTIALMLKAPAPGAVKTRLATEVGATQACIIYRRLVERQVRALPSEHKAIVCHDPPEAGPTMRSWLTPLSEVRLDFQPQCSGDLGARLADAFACAFRHHGTRKVIAIGGDCPTLDAARLRSADSALAQADVVIGPATDGGYYLIGLRAPQPELFEGIIWSTPAVLEQTRLRIRRGGLSLVELPMADDVDTLADWRRIEAQGILPAGP